jgi:hypothetical protein
MLVEISSQPKITCGAAAVFQVICGNPHVMHKEMSFLLICNSYGINLKNCPNFDVLLKMINVIENEKQHVIASEAKQSIFVSYVLSGLLRRCAPRNDEQNIPQEQGSPLLYARASYATP